MAEAKTAVVEETAPEVTPEALEAGDEMVTVSRADLADTMKTIVAEKLAEERAVTPTPKVERPSLFGTIGDDDLRTLNAKAFASRPKNDWVKDYRPETVLACRALYDPNAYQLFIMQNQARAILTGITDGATGGDDLLPEEFANIIVAAIEENTDIFKLVTVFPTTERNGKIPLLNADVTGGWVAEGAALSESTPTFTKDTWTAHKYGAYSKMTRELAEDSGVDIVSWTAKRLGEKLAEERNRAVIAGSGSSQPEGFYNKSGLSEYAVGGALSYDAIVELIHTLPAKYRKVQPDGANKAHMFMSDTNWKRVKKLKDGDGRPLLNFEPVAKFKDQILGFPVHNVNDDIGNDQICFGDPSYEYAFMRQGLIMEQSTVANDGTDSAFTKHLLLVKVLERYDAQYVLAAAMVKATGITS